MLPVATTWVVPKLSTLALPLMFAVPVMLAPVAVTFIVVVPPTTMFTLPAEVGMLTLDEPLAIDVGVPVVIPLRNAPLPKM